MAKGKSAQTRRPVKARGAIPVPKVAPPRTHVVWYRRRTLQIAGAVILLGLIALLTWSFLDNRGDEKALQERVSRFERRVNTLQATSPQAVQEMNTSPGELQAGRLSPEEYRKQTDAWLKQFQKVDISLRSGTVIDELVTARALLVNGNLILIDSIKAFQLAATAPDPATRDAAINQGRNLLQHGQAVYALGQREIQRVKKQVGLIGADEPNELLDQPPSLPAEDAPPPAPPPLELGSEQPPTSQPSP